MFIKRIISSIPFLLFSIVNFSQQTNLQFKHLTPNEGLTQSVIYNIYTDSRGFVWMTGLDGINRFDGTKCLANKEIAPGLAGVATTNGILEDNNGDIWFGYNEGLIKFSYRLNIFSIVPLNKLIRTSTNNSSQTYTPAITDADNSFVVGLNSDEIFIYNPTLNKITELPKPFEIGYSISALFLKKKNKGFLSLRTRINSKNSCPLLSFIPLRLPASLQL